MSVELIRLGATGDRVRELHERLADLGLERSTERVELYDAETVALVEAFQRSRGLPLTGVVDATTWERLSEARWQLGQRLLYLTRPFQRGDDVAELQVRLAQLGFNPGRIDGIFGPLLHDALSEFQRNRGLESNGVLCKATLLELRRVRLDHGQRSLVTDARDRAGFNLPSSGAVLLVGSGRLAQALDAAWRERASVRRLLGVTHEQAVDYANDHDVALVLSVVERGDVDGVSLHYWASYRSHSRQGEFVASALASELARVPGSPRVEVTGMALPILRETTMTSVQLEHGTLGDEPLHAFVTSIEAALDEVIHRTS